MDFDNMKKDKDFQKWCFDTELVGNKNWFNLENGSGDEVYIAYEAWIAGQQSKQAEIRKAILSLRNEFDLWADDTEPFHAIEAQIEQIEELLK